MKKFIALSTMAVCLCMFSLGCPSEAAKPAPSVTPEVTDGTTTTPAADAAPAEGTTTE